MPIEDLLNLIGVLFLGGLWFYACIRNTRKAWNGLGFKYSMKIFSSYFQFPIFFVLAVYWVLITVSVFPPLVRHIHSIISRGIILGCHYADGLCRYHYIGDGIYNANILKAFLEIN